MEKEINVLALAPGEKPRSVTLRNSLEDVAEFLGGPVEGLPVKLDNVFAFIVMFSRVSDLDAMAQNPDEKGIIPGPSILCGVDGNDLTSLPPDRREKFLRSYEQFGDMALTEEKIQPPFRPETPGRLPPVVLNFGKDGKVK